MRGQFLQQKVYLSNWRKARQMTRKFGKKQAGRVDSSEAGRVTIRKNI
jgi:hypothetical protein